MRFITPGMRPLLSVLNGLIRHIEGQLDPGNQHGRYSSIVQSSGMGKSRLLEEFSKNFLRYRSIRALQTLEVCLITGYFRHASPPAPDDNEVREFLADGTNYLKRGSFVPHTKLPRRTF
jgi:hypothetical protein